MMNVIPVIDILNGRCVAAKQGLRDHYEILKSQLCDQADSPLSLALAYRDLFGFEEVYIADLDAILYRRPNLIAIQSILKAGFKVWVDPGIRDIEDLHPWLSLGIHTLILGLESLKGPQQLERVCFDFSEELDRFLLSVDMKQGQLLLPEGSGWPEGISVPEIVNRSLTMGIQRFLLLDLALVGTGGGPIEASFVTSLIQGASRNPEIWLGGGVRDMNCLRQIERLPVKGVLVGTALHSGNIIPSHLME
ncbi:MAG: hypothetical protein RJA81_1963 [Planctomycetota bacterium]